MDWLQVWTKVGCESASLAESLLLAAGAASVTLQNAGDVPVLEPAPGETPLWPRVTVSGLFPDGVDPLEVLAALSGRPPEAEWRIASLVGRDWERAWLADVVPLQFGRRLAVVPGAMEAPPKRLAIRLDPGLAFGTGSHPTTALCLEWLDMLAVAERGARAPMEGALVLDYGCGSGILAIAALRLGAAAAVAVDVDPQALLASRDNAARNDFAGRLVACTPADLGAVLAGRKADILVANILAGPLLDLLPDFAAALAAGGRIGLSGILVGQETALVSAAGSWFRLDRPAIRDGWVRLTGRRKIAS